MGAAESAASAPAGAGPSSAELEALARRYGGGGGDGREPWGPEGAAPADDYDPRKPEYVLASTEEQREQGQALQLRQQMRRLQAALSKRQLDPSSHVVRHYEQVLSEMQLAVDTKAKGRSRSDALCDASLLSTYNGCLVRLLDFGRDMKEQLDKELSRSMAVHVGNIAPRLAIEAQPRGPSPTRPLAPPAGDSPTELSPTAGPDARPGAAAEVEYYWVQSGTTLSLSRIVETRSMSAQTAYPISHKLSK